MITATESLSHREVPRSSPSEREIRGRGHYDYSSLFTSPILLALYITIYQIALGLALAAPLSLSEGYRAFARWDVMWFASVSEAGYYVPENLSEHNTGNVAFFPGMPLVGRAVSTVTGLDAARGIILGSQLCTWVFWSYLLLLLRRWEVTPNRQALLLAVLLAQPGIFFLVTGYSESLFMAGLLGMIYWMDRDSAWADCIGALHGLAFGPARFVSLMLGAYPISRWLGSSERRRDSDGNIRWGRFARLALCSIFVMSCAMLHFAYLRLHFGSCDVFFEVQRVGWYIKPNYLFLFNLSSYVPKPVIHFYLGSDWLSHCAFMGTLAIFVVLARREWGLFLHGEKFKTYDRLGLFACAWLLFYMSAAAKATSGMNGMMRFAIPVVVLLALAVAHSQRGTSETVTSTRKRRAFAVYLVVCYALQLLCLYRFTHNVWVA